MSYERPNIQRMHGYTPGEQPADASVVKLNTNENPYPPTDAVMAALQAIEPDMLRRYPPPLATPFREVAAAVHDLHVEELIATNAGDELLRLAITTFVEPGRAIGTLDPCYSLYPVLAAVHDSPVHAVPLNDDWSIPTPTDVAEQLNDAGVQLTFVVNPHAPSGLLTRAETLTALAEELDGVLLIDEAYVDFVTPELKYDAIEIVKALDNVLLLRTLSKGYSLAGLRFGYGIGDPGLIEPMLTKTKDSYNVDAVAQRLAIAALLSRDDARKSWDAVRDERARVITALMDLGLTCVPSQTNFVLATHPDAATLYAALKQRSIFVRYFDADRLRDKLRITIGTPDQNDALLGAMGELL
ncbi:MAG: histidinol-phosphate transaminase [Phycisphaera sp.]|nr:histidinol-phosphate transaminase [Phycisphaera sp.]